MLVAMLPSHLDLACTGNSPEMKENKAQTFHCVQLIHK